MEKECVAKRELEIAKEVFVYLLKNGKMKIPYGAPLKGKSEEEKKIFFLKQIQKNIQLGKLSHGGKISRGVHFFTNGHVTYGEVEDFINSIRSRISCRVATE